jgi:hypothetical protein
VLSIGSSSLASTQVASGWTADFAIGQATINRHADYLSRQSIEPLTRLPGVKLTHDSTERLSLMRLEPEVSPKEVFKSLNSEELTQKTETWDENLPQETRR